MVSRRNFLKSSILSGAGAAFTIGGIAKVKASGKKNKPAIVTRKLGNTGLELPVISMGMTKLVDESVVKAAVRKGIKLFDSAHNASKENNEIMLGKALKSRKRKSFSIITKIKPEDYYTKGGKKELSEITTKKAFLDRFDTSLKRLQMEYVDILCVQAVSKPIAVHNKAIKEALTEAKISGKAKFIGISLHGYMPDMIDAVIKADFYDVVIVKHNFRKRHKELINEKINLLAKTGIGIIGMKTMAGGYIDDNQYYKINYKAALKWALQNPNIHTTIPAMNTYDHLLENMSVMNDLNMSVDEKNDIEKAILGTGIYCEDCLHCIPNCKKGLPINEIMRAYMYAYGYKEVKKAKQVLDDCNVGDNPCENCESCTVECLNNFNVAQKTADITRLNNIPDDFLS